MQEAGAEAGFVGTAGVVGAYTGMEDVGVASIPECVTIGGWIARAVRLPGHPRRRHRPRRDHGRAPPGGGLHPRRTGRRAHRRPGHRGQARHHQRRHHRRAARRGARALPRRGRLRARAGPELRRHGPVLRRRGRSTAASTKRCAACACTAKWRRRTGCSSPRRARSTRSARRAPWWTVRSRSWNRTCRRRSITAELLELGITLQWAPGVTHLAAQTAVYEMVQHYMQRGPVAVREFRERHPDNPYITRQLPKPAAVQQQRELEAATSELSKGSRKREGL